ncbi:MAG: BrxA family protein [Sedimentibacter sp.]|uniref:BrxA family protein n=1 Tax=Sedimentibacter sp. TaxID=1960295 RepID=UPI002981DF93|nr:BrxA family protein [Sedimentibacter sp.]MDW5299584.1 BrxA family protein [Sedimentibacter sp.]
MEKFKWTTSSAWLEETFEVFKYIDDQFSVDHLSDLVKNGILFGDRKESSAKRVFTAIKSRYLNDNIDRVVSLSKILGSSISEQEKKNYLLIFYLEYETLTQFFMAKYVYDNFNKLSQKIFTQMDLDKFFEIVLTDYKSLLPAKLQTEISKASMIKVRNQLSKNLEAFGWVEEKKDTFIIKRPGLTPEWFVFTLYMYFESDHISAKEVYQSDIYKRFLLNEYDIEYLIAGAKVKGLLETNRLGDINTITMKEKGLIDYARNFK